MYEEWLLSFVPPRGRTAIDVGSARGEWTFLLADRFEKVIAIDPIQPLFTQGFDNITLIQKGLWSSECTQSFAVYEDLNHTSTQFYDEGEFYGYEKRTGIREFECVTLNSLNVIDVDFIKIDTEGAEVEIVKGGMNCIAQCKPKLLIEIHGHERETPIREMLSPLYREIVKIPNPEGNAENYWIVTL